MPVDIVGMLFYVSPFWSPSDETAPHCDKIEYDRLQRTSSAFVPLTSCHFSSTILLNLKINVHRVKWSRTRCCWTAVRDVPVGKGRYSYQTPASLVGRMVYWAIQAGLLTPLTFARHRLSPLAAFTSGAYFLHNGQWICEFYTANFKGIFGGP